MNEEELLLHYGVKGMKWGVRRSRTSKGSITKRYMDASRKHEAKTAARHKQKAEKFAANKDRAVVVVKKAGSAYMDASRKHEAKTVARQKQKAENFAANKDKVVTNVKKAGSAYMDASRKHEAKTAARHKQKAEKLADYGKTYKKTVKDSFKNSTAQSKAELQLLKEKPRTALYRTKADLDRLNELTDQNVLNKKLKKKKR